MFVSIHRRSRREALDRAPPAAEAVNLGQALDRLDPFAVRSNQKSVHAGPYDFRQCAARARDDRRSAGQGFGEYDAERLVPFHRNNQRRRPSKQLILLMIIDRTHVVDPVMPQGGFNTFLPIAARLSVRGMVSRQQEPPLGLPGDRNRPMGALDRFDAA